MISTDTESLEKPENPIATRDEFLASNAGFFAQSFVELNEIFHSSGPMNIVSEGAKNTVVVGVLEADDEGAMDVNCVLLKPNQESLRNCINTLFLENQARL